MATPRRRGHGEGAVYQRPDKRWCAQLDLGWQDGARRRKTIYAATKREALDALDRLREGRRKGALPRLGRQTTGDYLERWLNDNAKLTVRPSTFRRYADIVEHHLIPSLGRVPLEKLSRQHVTALYREKAEAGLSPRSVHHLRAVLRVALNQAVAAGELPNNAAALAKPPQVPETEMKTLSPAEAQLLLEHVRNDPAEALYTLVLALGLRQGEALGLRWKDIDLERRRLTVAQALQRVDGHLVAVPPKTRRSRRVLTLPTVAADALRAHRSRQNQQQLYAGTQWAGGGDWVFTTTIGTPLDGTTVTHRFQQHLAEIGLPRVRFHDLRHSAASMLYAQGVPMRTIMEILGHSTITLTANTYSHLAEEAHQGSADAMDRALAPRPL